MICLTGTDYHLHAYCVSSQVLQVRLTGTEDSLYRVSLCSVIGFHSKLFKDEHLVMLTASWS